MMSILGKSYVELETEIVTGRAHMPSLEERYALLANMEVPSLDPQNINSIINFGNNLLPHSEFINSESGKLTLSREIDVSSDLIMKITQKIDLFTPEKRNLLFTKRLLFLKKKTAPTLTTLTNNNQDLEGTISKSINALQQEIIKYDQILKFLGLYQQKNAEHLHIMQEALNQKEVEETMPGNPNMATVLQKSTYLSLIEDKKSAFEATDTYITTEIIRINQAIMDHSISLKALTISMQSLLPLAKTALALIEGQKNDQYALNIYSSTLELCQNLFNKNVEGTINNIETLKQVIPENAFNKIENDVNAYLSLLQNITPTSTPVPKIG